MVVAVSKVNSKVSPLASWPLSNAPSSAVTVCGKEPLSVQITVVPAGISSVAGVYLLSVMSMVTVLAAGAAVSVGGTSTTAVASGGWVACTWGSGVAVAAGLPPRLHAITAITHRLNTARAGWGRWWRRGRDGSVDIEPPIKTSGGQAGRVGSILRRPGPERSGEKLRIDRLGVAINRE